MAFLGDFGRFFLGGKTTADVGANVGTFIGGKIGGASGALAGANLGRSTGALLGNLGTADQPGQQSALPTPPPRRPADLGAQEDRESGSTIINLGTNMRQQQAGFGNLLPFIPQLTKLFTGRTGQIATGVGAGAALFGGDGDQRMKPVLTQSRRNKAKVRQLVNFMGIEGAADFLSQSSGQNVDPNDVVMLLLRTFRNDGAFITKAQVRNLRRTTNRFKSLEKQVKEATSMSRTTRRAPVRRSTASTTLIRN